MLPRADLPGNANSLQNMTLVSEVGKIPLAPNDICTVLWHETAGSNLSGCLQGRHGCCHKFNKMQLQFINSVVNSL